MLNPIASEAIFSATYVDNYIDSVENLPDDVQRQLSRIRDIDVQYRSHLRDVDHYYDLWKTLQNSGDASANRRARAIVRMQQSLIQAQELGDEKMQIVNQLQELIDHKTRQLDSDQKNLDIKEEPQQSDLQNASTPSKVARTQSPSRDNMPANGTSSTDVGACKESPAYGAYTSSVACSGNGTATPSTDRSVSNGNNASLGTGFPACGTQGTGNNAGVGNSDSQRSANKRSRRRNETINQMELCGNESNSANEAGSGVGAVGSAEKSSIVNIIGASSQKQNTIGSASSTALKKNCVQGQGSSAAGGSCNSAGAAGSSIGSSASGGNNSGKKKKRKARGAQAANAQNTREETPPPDPIDPDEPTYCLCDQISFGEMILCDNDLCPIEWFHFSCVSLVLKPKGKWYCPNCRGDRPNVMKPKAQFLKELERYNKEKEEKT